MRARQPRPTTVYNLRPSKSVNPKYPWVVDELRNVLKYADRTTFTVGRSRYFTKREDAVRKLHELSRGAK